MDCQRVAIPAASLSGNVCALEQVIAYKTNSYLMHILPTVFESVILLYIYILVKNILCI